VVLAGDYNVVPTPQDIYPTRSLDNNALIQPESRRAFARLLAQRWTDAMRRLHPDGPLWTFWNYKYGRWPKDKGMRLDHFLLSPTVSNRLVDGGVDRWARRQVNARPCANMDNARSLDQSCVNHEFIENKPLETKGARVLSRIFAKTPPSARAQLPLRTTSHLLFGSNHELCGHYLNERVADRRRRSNRANRGTLLGV